MQPWIGEVRACGEQYERWINIGQTGIDFLSYLIALVSASAEDTLDQVYRESDRPWNPELSNGKKPFLENRIDMLPLPCRWLNTGWPFFDLWQLRTRRLDETIEMARSDMLYWMQRMTRTWSAALTIGNSVSGRRERLY